MANHPEMAEKINVQISQIARHIIQFISAHGDTTESTKNQEYIQQQFNFLKDMLKNIDNQEILNLIYQIFQKIHNVALNYPSYSSNHMHEHLQKFQENFNREIFSLIQRVMEGKMSDSLKNGYTAFG